MAIQGKVILPCPQGLPLAGAALPADCLAIGQTGTVSI
jgi:hypothetical protein